MRFGLSTTAAVGRNICALCLIMSLHLWQIQRVKSLPAKVAGALGERQNYVYKRAAAMLLIFGAAGGSTLAFHAR